MTLSPPPPISPPYPFKGKGGFSAILRKWGGDWGTETLDGLRGSYYSQQRTYVKEQRVDGSSASLDVVRCTLVAGKPVLERKK